MEDHGLVVSRSAYPVAETLDRLEAILTHAGNTIFTRIDHAANAETAGLAMRPTQVLIWGSATAGTALMNQAPTLAIDLPQKFLAWEDAEGVTWVAFNRMAYLARRHELQGFDSVVVTFDLRLEAIVRDVSAHALDAAPPSGTTSSGT